MIKIENYTIVDAVNIYSHGNDYAFSGVGGNENTFATLVTREGKELRYENRVGSSQCGNTWESVTVTDEDGNIIFSETEEAGTGCWQSSQNESSEFADVTKELIKFVGVGAEYSTWPD